MSETLLEKLQFKDEKNLLIQGLPSSIEKQFFKLTFAKNMTPLLKTRKIDFALVFAVNETQLAGIINEVIPALHTEGKLWVAYPKKTSKIATTLNRDCSWECISSKGFTEVRQISLDHVWTAMRFKKTEQIQTLTRAVANGGISVTAEGVDTKKRVVQPPSDFMKGLNRNKTASHFFDNLSFTNKKEYVTWVTSAKREDTRSRRLESAIDKLSAGKKIRAKNKIITKIFFQRFASKQQTFFILLITGKFMAFINIEIKARTAKADFIRKYLLENGADFKGTDNQTDTYFNVPNGRLKLRQGNIENTLIQYFRPNQHGPKQSNFKLMEVINGEVLKEILTASLGIKVVVKKKREIYFIENIKFHLDKLEGLGNFVEIEASNKNHDLPLEKLHEQCNFYKNVFEINEEDLINISYSDMVI